MDMVSVLLHSRRPIPETGYFKLDAITEENYWGKYP